MIRSAVVVAAVSGAAARQAAELCVGAAATMSDVARPVGAPERGDGLRRVVELRGDPREQRCRALPAETDQAHGAAVAQRLRGRRGRRAW